MNEGAGDGKALAHSARKSTDQTGGAFCQASGSKELRCAGCCIRDVIEPREEEKILFGGQFVVKKCAMRDHTNPALCDFWRIRRQPAHLDASRIRAHE